MKIRPETGQDILVEHAARDEDLRGPSDLPLRALRGGERRHARIGPHVSPGRGIHSTQLTTCLPQHGLGQQPQVGLGPLIAHPPSLHRPGPGDDLAARGGIKCPTPWPCDPE